MGSSTVQYGNLPFKEAVEFFRGKISLPTRAWTDIWQHQHDVAFVVAGATQADLLADFRAAIAKAQEQGTTLAEFRKDFDRIVKEHGWSYKGGRNWRTRVIYETNLRTAYQAGRYQQMQVVKKTRPWWRYIHSDAVEHPRPEHEAWHGLVLAADDPWWDTHFPPNGWGCKCRVQSLNQRDLDRLGKSGPDQAPPINKVEKTVGTRGPSPRTVDVPQGIDPGWAYAPGQQRQQILEYAAEKAGKLPETVGAAYVSRLVGSQAFRRWLDAPTGLFPVARLPDAHAEKIGATARYAALSAESARKQTKAHPEIAAGEYLQIQIAIDRGERIRDGSSWVYVLDEPDGYVTVVKATGSGLALFLTSFRRLSGDQVKRDQELARLRRKKK